ncbi:MAG: ABC transporter substrate-binding protein [Methanoregula sp.]
MVRKKTRNILIIVACVILILAGAWYLARAPEGYAGPVVSLTIGMPPIEYSALIYIADDRHYFSDNGLDVTIKKYDAGLYAVNGLLAGETDMALATEYVLAGKSLDNASVTALGNIDAFENIFFIARKDRGISTPADLKGKKIGVPRQTSAEFFLGRYLNLHGISLDEVTIVDQKPQQLKDALMNKDVDAVVIWEPFATPITDQLGENASAWPAQSGQYAYWLVISNRSWAADHPSTIERFWRALLLAEAYAQSDPAGARAIVVKKTGYDPVLLEKVWPREHFTLSLDQGLILAMEDESRWMMKNNLTSARQMPNYLDYLDGKGLGSVRPGAVSIIR